MTDTDKYWDRQRKSTVNARRNELMTCEMASRFIYRTNLVPYFRRRKSMAKMAGCHKKKAEFSHSLPKKNTKLLTRVQHEAWLNATIIFSKLKQARDNYKACDRHIASMQTNPLLASSLVLFGFTLIQVLISLLIMVVLRKMRRRACVLFLKHFHPEALKEVDIYISVIAAR